MLFYESFFRLDYNSSIFPKICQNISIGENMTKTKEIKSATETKETLKQQFEELIQNLTELNVQHQSGQLKKTH